MAAETGSTPTGADPEPISGCPPLFPSGSVRGVPTPTSSDDRSGCLRAASRSWECCQERDGGTDLRVELVPAKHDPVGEVARTLRLPLAAVAGGVVGLAVASIGLFGAPGPVSSGDLPAGVGGLHEPGSPGRGRLHGRLRVRWSGERHRWMPLQIERIVLVGQFFHGAHLMGIVM